MPGSIALRRGGRQGFCPHTDKPLVTSRLRRTLFWNDLLVKQWSRCNQERTGATISAEQVIQRTAPGKGERRPRQESGCRDRFVACGAELSTTIPASSRTFPYMQHSESPNERAVAALIFMRPQEM
jgi:hypothetical protein